MQNALSAEHSIAHRNIKLYFYDIAMLLLSGCASVLLSDVEVPYFLGYVIVITGLISLESLLSGAST